MKLIKLTRKVNKQPILINPTHIRAIYEFGKVGTAAVEFSSYDDYVHVLESVEEVAKLIERTMAYDT